MGIYYTDRSLELCDGATLCTDVHKMTDFVLIGATMWDLGQKLRKFRI